LLQANLVGCSLKLMDSVLNITFSVMARWASHRDVTSKFDPIKFSTFHFIRAVTLV